MTGAPLQRPQTPECRGSSSPCRVCGGPVPPPVGKRIPARLCGKKCRKEADRQRQALKRNQPDALRARAAALRVEAARLDREADDLEG